MDMEKKVTILKAMLDDDTPDDVLRIYLEIAGDKILNRMYPYLESYDGKEVPAKYAMVQVNVAAYLLNKRGAEGQIQHIENGIHRNYGDADVPEGMMKDVVPFCKVIR